VDVLKHAGVLTDIIDIDMLCSLSLLLQSAFWRFTEYLTPTNAPIVYLIL